MAVERAAGGTSLIDVLDRVLDKGIVIDAWVRVSLVGIDLITVEAEVLRSRRGGDRGRTARVGAGAELRGNLRRERRAAGAARKQLDGRAADDDAGEGASTDEVRGGRPHQ
jgi:hypothetical protein